MPSNSRRRCSANGQWGQFVPRRSGRGPKKDQEKGSNKKRKRGDRGVADNECDTSNGSNSLIHQQHNDDILQGSSPPAPTGGGTNILSTSDYTLLSSNTLEDMLYTGSPLFYTTKDIELDNYASKSLDCDGAATAGGVAGITILQPSIIKEEIKTCV